MEPRGLTHVYFGDGKGKTTAALGMALRALGYGRGVVIVQFLKNVFSGELRALERFPKAKVLRGQASDKFLPAMTGEEQEETRRIQEENFREAVRLAREGACDLLILDEVLDACQLGLLDGTALLDFIDHKPAGLELVLTGHSLTEGILARADYATQMVKRKHPYDRGIPAREGIEY